MVAPSADAFGLGLRAVALEHQVGGPPDVDFRLHKITENYSLVTTLHLGVTLSSYIGSIGAVAAASRPEH